MPLITPKILKGTRDFDTKTMAKRQFVMDNITSTFRTCGYDAIETPAIEYAETLLGKYGEEGNKLLYQFRDNGDRNIALRYDQTIPTARFVAMNYGTLTLPFKRYQIGPVWRADKPAKGRYREFYQCDIDIIGTTSLLADVEVASVISLLFTALGFNDFVLKINSRRLINTLLTSLDIPAEKQTAVIRIIDKLDKIGLEGVEKELTNSINTQTIQALRSRISVTGSNAEKVASLAPLDTSEVSQFLSLCTNAGITEQNIVFDPSLARGLDYYTGMIFEVSIPDVDVGSVCGGGRYDNLCSMFMNTSVSGVGVAFGLDRIIIAMEERGLLSDISQACDVLVTLFDSASESASLTLLSRLRDAGIASEMYLEPQKMKKQLTYANKRNIPIVIIAGPGELEQNSVTIKLMDTGTQDTIPRDTLVTYIQDVLK